ncbi:MAG: VOC family protein [Gemmatimonadaceae bacterium]|nr:VOC family protein [Gemmatimonadaceae bacterium]
MAAGEEQVRGGPSSPVRHFAINADDLDRAQTFYQHVFGWRFHAWGPPNFYMIETGSTAETPAIFGSLQGRRTLVEGERMTGFECTIAVSDIHATARAIEAAGGQILMPPTTIPTVGHLLWFRDSEGNVAGAMEPDSRPIAIDV